MPSINIDDRAGARAGARHLVELGHRRIGIVSSSAVGPHGLIPEPVSTPGGHAAHERLQGWLDELDAAGIRPTVVVQPPYAPQATGDAARQLLDVADPPTAILCFSDVIALGVVSVARERGLRVPEDLSVVGFDDAPLAARATPSLTTVRQDVLAKGRAAAAALTALLATDRPGGEGPGDEQCAVHLVLPTELVVRDSTGPAPAA